MKINDINGTIIDTDKLNDVDSLIIEESRKLYELCIKYNIPLFMVILKSDNKTIGHINPSSKLKEGYLWGGLNSALKYLSNNIFYLGDIRKNEN